MKYSIIPEPLEMSVGDRVVFRLTEMCEVEYDRTSQKAYNALVKFLSDSFSMSFEGVGEGKIILKTDDALDAPESYTLTVKEGIVEIIGKDEAGAFYGVQSLKQLLFQGDLELPEITIKDKPRFAYRGFLLDCGRYFFTVEAVKVFLEMMALHKLNTFHWHLSEDQGFRAQILDKLLLTEIGSYRSHTNFNSKKHEGYYTVDDMKEIVEYAHNLSIKVIPEIDTPGHTVAMISAYPELSCFNRELPVATHWGVKHDVLCIGKESTFEFMETVFDELLETFTDGTFHLGGDEVPTTRWEICPHCQARMKAEGLTETGELHRYYLDRIGTYFKSKGVETVMWNDRIKDKMVSKDIAWQLWDGQMKKDEVAKELNSGRKFIISASEAYYLNFPYAVTNMKQCYDFEPVFDGVTPEGEKNLLGIEGCLWCEYVPSMKTAGYCTYPRLGAVSETAWTAKNKKDYTKFEEKLDSYYSLLEGYGIDFAKKNQAMPGFFRKTANALYWKRRPLHWHGLHNVIDNANVKRKYASKEK